MTTSVTKPSPSEIRMISLGSGCCRLPERLLLSHGRGETLFITGAGTSKPAGLPDFRELVLEVYKQLDRPLHSLLEKIPRGACNRWELTSNHLRPDQLAEAQRFIQGDYDVALGMLERRIDHTSSPTTKVRETISSVLRLAGTKPAEIHKSLIRLADRGRATTIVTTNFDLLLEVAAQWQRKKLETYSLASIPRPGRASEFSGILHVHGALSRSAGRASSCIVSDQDFGEYYLRRQVVPEFIYDAARLFNLVLVGYSASDPPMRYLLNAVAADGNRFTDLKERYAFVGGPEPADPVIMNDWLGRGITPIPYDARDNHKQLSTTLTKWASLSQVNGDEKAAEPAIKRIVKASRSSAAVEDRDLFDYFYRRGSDSERRRFSTLISSAGADPSWLDAILDIAREPRMEASI